MMSETSALPSFQQGILSHLGFSRSSEDHLDSESRWSGETESDGVRPLAGFTRIWGTLGDDTLTGTDHRDILRGFTGDDSLDGGNGNDLLRGGLGDDQLTGGEGHDLLFGALGNDSLSGDAGRDFLFGGWGDDWISGGEDRDTLLGGAGADHLLGDGGNDVLFGHTGNDCLEGGDGNDVLFGGRGDDQLYGGAGNDILRGGAGTNLLYGQDGDDLYRVSGHLEGDYATTISDTAGTNLLSFLDLSSSDLAGLQAIDTNGNGMVDTLLIQVSDTQTVSVDQYFSDTAATVSDSTAGAGAMAIHFADHATWQFDDVSHALTLL